MSTSSCWNIPKTFPPQERWNKSLHQHSISARQCTARHWTECGADNHSFSLSTSSQLTSPPCLAHSLRMEIILMKIENQLEQANYVAVIVDGRYLFLLSSARFILLMKQRQNEKIKAWLSFQCIQQKYSNQWIISITLVWLNRRMYILLQRKPVICYLTLWKISIF